MSIFKMAVTNIWYLTNVIYAFLVQLYKVFCNLILISPLNFRALTIKTYLFPTKITFKQSLPECILFPPGGRTFALNKAAIHPLNLATMFTPPPFPPHSGKIRGEGNMSVLLGGIVCLRGFREGIIEGGIGYVLGGFRGEREFRGEMRGRNLIDIWNLVTILPLPFPP